MLLKSLSLANLHAHFLILCGILFQIVWFICKLTVSQHCLLLLIVQFLFFSSCYNRDLLSLLELVEFVLGAPLPGENLLETLSKHLMLAVSSSFGL